MKNTPKLLLPMILSALIPAQAAATNCFLTLVKDSCWTNYDVSVNVSDNASGKSLVNVSVPKSKSWTRQAFTCQPSEGLDFSAIYSPVFWQADKGKHYPGKKSWTLPSSLKKGETAWNVTVCYPQDFSEVPLPPTAGSNCTCDTQDIPPVQAPETAS